MTINIPVRCRTLRMLLVVLPAQESSSSTDSRTYLRICQQTITLLILSILNLSVMADTTKSGTPTQKSAPGATWKNNEEHVVPKNRLRIVFVGLMCSVFLAALDQVLFILIVYNYFLTKTLLDHCRNCPSNDSGTTWRW